MFVTCNKIGRHSQVTVMPKTKTFINCAQLGTGSFTIKPQKVSLQAAGTINRPTKQLMRYLAAGKRPPNGKAMNKDRLSLRHIRPEFFVFELKFDYTSRFPIVFPDKEKPGDNFGSYDFRNELVITPHRHIALTQPGSGFQKNIGYYLYVRRSGLFNTDFHHSLTGMFFSARNFFTSPTV